MFTLEQTTSWGCVLILVGLLRLVRGHRVRREQAEEMRIAQKRNTETRRKLMEENDKWKKACVYVPKERANRRHLESQANLNPVLEITEDDVEIMLAEIPGKVVATKDDGYKFDSRDSVAILEQLKVSTEPGLAETKEASLGIPEIVPAPESSAGIIRKKATWGPAARVAATRAKSMKRAMIRAGLWQEPVEKQKRRVKC